VTLPPLFGAFWSDARPLEQRGLALRVAALRRAGGGARWRELSLRGTIDAEGLCSGAPFEGCATLEGARLRIEVRFESRDHLPHALALELRPGRPSLRSLTDLAGAILRGGERWGAAHVRIDWRRLLRV
jgi:hypothetical protein